MKLLDWFRSSARNRKPDTVSFDDDRVFRDLGDGRTESIRRAELEKVTVLTTDAGPWAEDVFVLLEGRAGGCAVPQGSVGSQELIEQLLKLPGFDEKKLIEAMSSTSNARFVSWVKEHVP